MEFLAQPRSTTSTSPSLAFGVESILRCLVHLLFMQNGVVERSVRVVHL